jgi:WD40 repeat protein
MVTASADRTLRFWSIASLTTATRKNQRVNVDGHISKCCFSADGTILFAAVADTNQIRIYNVQEKVSALALRWWCY